MRILKATGRLIVAAIFVLGLVINFTGCSNDFSPLALEETDIAVNEELEFVSFAKDDPSLSKKKVFKSTGLVTYEKGGELKIDFNPNENASHLIQVNVSFRVAEQSISEDAVLGLTLDPTLTSGNVDAEFKPHGIVFYNPAILNIEIKNVCLDYIEVDRLGIYYVNEETGVWEKMEVKEIIVDKENGYLKIHDALIPHFSRYALAYAR